MNTLGPSLDTARQRLEGIAQGHVRAGPAALSQAQLDARLAQIDDWIERGAIAPHVAKSFPIAEFAEAARAKWTSALVGSIALLP